MLNHPASFRQNRIPSAQSHLVKSYPPRSVFISYNHDESRNIAGRIYERLSSRLSPEAVFKDDEGAVRAIGRDFRETFKAALNQCRVVLVVIDPQWYDRRMESERQADDIPPDWVRIEVESALKTPDLIIIPLLVDGAEFPKNKSLPASISDLRYRDGKRIHSDEGFGASMDDLVRHLQPLLIARKPGPKSSWRPMALCAAVVALLTAGWAGWMKVQSMQSPGAKSQQAIVAPDPQPLPPAVVPPKPAAFKVAFFKKDGVTPLAGATVAGRRATDSTDPRWPNNINGLSFDFYVKGTSDEPLMVSGTYEVRYTALASDDPRAKTSPQSLIVDHELVSDADYWAVVHRLKAEEGPQTHSIWWGDAFDPEDPKKYLTTYTLKEGKAQEGSFFVGKNGTLPNGTFPVRVLYYSKQERSGEILGEVDFHIEYP